MDQSRTAFIENITTKKRLTLKGFKGFSLLYITTFFILSMSVRIKNRLYSLFNQTSY